MENLRYTGLLPILGSQPGNKDYIDGLVSGIQYQVVREDGKWLMYRSSGEQQFSIYMDSLGCVTFSFNNGVEEYINFLRAIGLLNHTVVASLLPSAEDQELFWHFFNDNGEANLSDRALAKASGTDMIKGNTLSRVADFGRVYAVPERAWPYPVTQRTPVFDWEDFYAEVPKDMAKKYTDIFFKVFKIETEFITPTWESIEKHLKQGPIQIASGYCPGWGVDRPVKACGRNNDHATLIDGQTQNSYNDFDHYPPFDKELAKDYVINGALKIIVSIKNPITQPPMIVKENTLYQLVEHPGGFALGLNGKLAIDDLAKILASWQVRNNGKTDGKIATCNLADWNSVPHINLKGEAVE